MTQKEFLEAMIKAEPGIMPAPPIPLKLGKADIEACRLLLYIYDQYQDESLGFVDDILDAAKWWLTFWGAAFTAAENLKNE